MGGPEAVWATRRPLLASQMTALKTAVAMSASAKGTVVGGRGHRAGRPARRLRAGHQRDAELRRRR